jgi:hypothetical protein
MPPDDDQLRAIGRVTLLFNDLEHSMNLLVWRLINPDINIGRIVLEGEGFDRMLKRLTRLSQEVAREDLELRGTIRQWANRADNVRIRRNGVLHARWIFSLASGEMVAVRGLGKAPGEVDISAAALDRLANDIHHVAVELESIGRRVLYP